MLLVLAGTAENMLFLIISATVGANAGQIFLQVIDISH
jgi:hypothetical protein